MHLQELRVEVDGQVIGDIKLGRARTIRIDDALPPDDHKIVRLRASLLPHLPAGKQFPIHLRYLIDGKFVNEYNHIIRLTPPSSALLQIVDGLCSALRDMAIGCKAEEGWTLVEATKIIVLASLILLLTLDPPVFYIMARSIDQGRASGLLSVFSIKMGITFVLIAYITVNCYALMAGTAQRLLNGYRRF